MEKPRTSSAMRRSVPRPRKRTTGRSAIQETPLAVRSTGVERAMGLDDYVRKTLGRRLAKHGAAIERVTVRFEDVNGPRGGVDTLARIKVTLSGRPSVIVAGHATDPRAALDVASHGASRAVTEALRRAGVATRRRATAGRTVPPGEFRAPNPPPPGGALIGRRVGRAASNLEAALQRPEKLRRDAYVDTSLPGISATDRKAGGGSTARRNTKARTRRATATLEDSATGRPSRKSTRKSANRAKQGSKLSRRATAKTTSPKKRAHKASAAGSRARSAAAG